MATAIRQWTRLLKMTVGSERAGHAAAINYSLVESCKANKVNPLTYLTHILGNARNKSITLPTPDEFADSNIAHVR